MHILITGGAGFFGDILKKTLIENGHTCVSIDLQPDAYMHPQLQTLQADVRNAALMDEIFATHAFDAVFHCAAILAHVGAKKDFLWSCNVDGTRVIAECCARHSCKVIFLSTNCLWATAFNRPVTEDDIPAPAELYGKSKLAAENILLSYADRFPVIIFRCPTIVDEGRLGLLSILFEFIHEGRKVWLIGGGKNRYQFIYAQDLAAACLRALDYHQSDIFNIGSDNVRSFEEIYKYVIEKAGSNAKTVAIAKAPTLLAMRIAHTLRLSPLGPYQYKMIASDFVFHTGKIKQKFGLMPTLTNEEMLWKAYEYYSTHRDAIGKRVNVSAHKQPAKMGIIRILKWLS